MLKRVGVVCVLVAMGVTVAAVVGLAQEPPKTSLVAVNIFGPIFGLYEGYYETKVSESLGFYIAPQYLNLKLSLIGALLPEDFYFWGLGATAGANLYFSGAIEGFFVGGGAKLLFITLGTTSPPSAASGLAIGLTAQVGYRWIFGNFSLAPQLNAGYTALLFTAPGASDLFGGFAWGIGFGLAFAF